MTRNFMDYKGRKRREFGEKFSTEDLPEKFVRYYESGERVKVRFEFDDSHEDLTGTLGVTTGWRPAFLLMRTSRSSGSPYLLREKDHVVAVKRGRQYKETSK